MPYYKGQLWNLTKTLSIGISLILLIALSPVAFGQEDLFGANTLNSEAHRLNNLGEYEKALDLLDKALEINPNHIHALNNKGRALLELDKTEEAIVWFDKALEVNPEYIPALHNKGLILLELGKYEEAMVWFDKALEVNPNLVYLLNDKGLALYRLGQYDEAISYYDKALEINPNYELAKKNKELALERDEGGIWDYSELIAIAVVVVIISVIIPTIKKRNTQKLLKQKEQFRRHSFFVKKTRYTGTNITYAVLFDKERILFVHSHKITKAPKESNVDEILKMSKHNFQILWEEVKKFEVNDSSEGSEGARTGELIVEWKERKEKFDITYGQDFKECEKTIKTFWPPRGSMPKGYV